MRLPHLSLAATALLLLATPSIQAAEVAKVEVLGLDEVMTENVRGALSLVDAIGKDVSGRRMAYLIREALEPFGYYSPAITVDHTRDEAPPVRRVG